MAGVPGVADPSDRFALGDLLTDVDGDAVLAEVAHQQVAAAAEVDHQLISCGVLGVYRPDRQVGVASTT
jgi:hypothetical protein